MSNQLVQERFRQNSSSLRYNPFDAIANTNPEIASLIYLNKNGILQPEVMPLIATFRTLEAKEKLGAMNAIVAHAKIDADERVALFGEQEKTQRTRIRYDAAMEMTRLKCEANIAIVNAKVAGAKYISDNELKARYTEAVAQRDAIIASERIRALAKVKESEDALVAEVARAEFAYLAEIKKAEEIRAIEFGKLVSKTTRDYLKTQAELYRLAIQSQIIEGRLEQEETRVTYSGLARIIKNCGKLLHGTGRNKLEIVAETPIGPIKLEIRVE